MLIGRGRSVWIVLKYLDRVTKVASVVVGALQKVDATKVYTFLAPSIKSVQNGWAVAAIMILAPMIVTARSRTDRSRMEAVKKLLDQLCDETFRKEDFDHDQYRRVTLFKHRNFCLWRLPCFGGWLVPVERSGTRTRKTDAIFRAPDNGEKCEGVAGRAWSGATTVYVPSLPNLRADAALETDFTKYAELSFCKVDMLRNKPPQSRSLMGVYIEVDGRPWGVIVVDSVNESFNKKRFNAAFKHLAPVLSSYLKGM